MNQPAPPARGSRTIKESDIVVERGGDRKRRQARLERGVPLTWSGGAANNGSDIADSAIFPVWDTVLDMELGCMRGDYCKYR